MKRSPKNATADFLLEIGCEEIPAGMIPKAAEELKVILVKYFATLALSESPQVRTYGAPRRLVAEASGLLRRQTDVVREVTGPPKTVAYDSSGNPTRAAESFATKQGVGLHELYLATTPKGEYVAARQTISGRPAIALLAEVLPNAIQEIPWPRSMYWGSSSDVRFIRPIRWIVALLGGRVIPFELGGVRAGNRSQGHRFLASGMVAAKGLKDLEQSLKKSYVILRPEERRKRIENEIAALMKKRGLKVHADPDLLEKVTYLNEYPSVILGDYAPQFLALPQEILITVMRDHQKYFAVEKRDGGLAPHFLAVINMARDRRGEVRRGHERVLRARFADARFFWDSDQKCRLADNLPKLAQVTYESRLGSYAAKVERMKLLAAWQAGSWKEAGVPGADSAAAPHAAELAKCDLVTEMVREFTELQGIVGGLYARAQGEPKEIAEAIYDHYRPAGLDDAVPRNVTGCAVALADKLDALVGCFAVGLVPSGSSDPYGLRRAALGVVKIILDTKLPVSLPTALHTAAGILALNPPKIDVPAKTQSQVREFIVERAKFVFRERLGFAYDEVNAVLAASSDDLVDAQKRLETLKAIRKTKNFEPLAVAFKRIRKILEKAGPEKSWKLDAVHPERFTLDAEGLLHKESERVAREAATHKHKGHYREALMAIAALRPAVDRFFDEVMVMVDEEDIRRNRLTLLLQLLKEFSTIADFSEIVTEEKR
jgi:glycyl-tRNA synthetase beta chain